jgi:sigma-B regulation protein RsbU (phosphoserine phosphatase)
MAENDLKQLQKELKFKKLQLNSIYELSSAIHSSFDIDHVIRIFFSTLMAPLGVTRTFFFEPYQSIFRKRGFVLSEAESLFIKKNARKALAGTPAVDVEFLPAHQEKIKKMLLAKGIYYLLNISENKKKTIVLGLGRKFNQRPMEQEDCEFAYILSRFMLIELDNIHYLAQIFAKKKLEHEMKIARDIQLSLLPQKLPELKNFDISVIYETIQEVGGDYYDFFKKKKNIQPLVLADVEGKGLSAALLAASCQAIFHSLNELYLHKPAKFIGKANTLIHGITNGSRFITLFWMVLNDEIPALTYVNAGHNQPYLISGAKVSKLSEGGFLIGFSAGTTYEQKTIPLSRGDIVCAFTDGVFEVQNPRGEEFGEQAIVDFMRRNPGMTAAELSSGLYKKIKSFAEDTCFHDDFTILIIKVR